MVRSGNFKDKPDIKSFKTDEQVMLNYMPAKHVVKNWCTRKRSYNLVKDINTRRSFEEAFSNWFPSTRVQHPYPLYTLGKK